MASDLDQTHFYNLISSRKLSEYIGVDIVGKCGDFSDQQVPSDDHYRFTTCNHLQLKLSRFYLAFENHNCPDYITEKFFNVIRTRKMIPIVMGASKEAYNLFGPEVKVNALENIVTFLCGRDPLSMWMTLKVLPRLEPTCNTSRMIQ